MKEQKSKSQNGQNFIRVSGARENNLKNVLLDIRKKIITVFTGISGSGKFSLVFDTIAAESQRQLNETFTTFIRNRLPHYGQPDADKLKNLSPVIVDQKRLGSKSLSKTAARNWKTSSNGIFISSKVSRSNRFSKLSNASETTARSAHADRRLRVETDESRLSGRNGRDSGRSAVTAARIAKSKSYV